MFPEIGLKTIKFDNKKTIKFDQGGVNKQSNLINKLTILIKTTPPGRGSALGAPLEAAPLLF
jgi:hypothetical protein